MLDDDERLHNASSILAVGHLDSDIRSIVIVVISDSTDSGSHLAERMPARSLFVLKQTPYVVFGIFAVLVHLKVVASHPSQFSKEIDPYRLFGCKFFR